MRKFSAIYFILILCLLPSALVFADEKIQYDFDEVEVIFAAEFTANPVYVEVYGWHMDLTGGEKAPLEVLYGVVKLKNNGFGDMTEEFIKVSGSSGSERFLKNSGSYDYYEGTSKLRKARTMFWSAKKLIGNSVVKDFSGPLKIITMERNFDENQNLISITISFPGESYDFWSNGPLDNLYQMDPNTLNSTGLPKASS